MIPFNKCPENGYTIIGTLWYLCIVISQLFGLGNNGSVFENFKAFVYYLFDRRIMTQARQRNFFGMP